MSDSVLFGALLGTVFGLGIVAATLPLGFAVASGAAALVLGGTAAAYFGIGGVR